MIAKKTMVELQAGQMRLSTVSDEIARVRITECSRFRGKRDTAAVAECAGYKLNDQLTTECLSGKHCLPEFRETALGAIIALSSVPSPSKLLTHAGLPRIVPPGSLGEFDAAARACRKENADVYAASLCVLQSRVSEKDKQTLACLKDFKVGKTSGTSCLVYSLTDEKTKKTIACIAGLKRNPRAAVLCGAPGAMGSDVARAVSCFQKPNHKAADVALCFGSGKLNKDQQIAVGCLNAHGNDWAGAATCMAEQKGSLPPQATQALSCAAEHGSDTGSFATCMASKNLPELPGELGRLAKCAIMNRCPLAIAACMTADLTTEQQIAIQCACQSPDITSFAGCTCGQLTVREFIKCKDKNLGEGECFGENNEIRRFARNVFGQDINDKTVLGQALNVQLNLAKAQVAFAEAAGKSLEQIADGAVKVGDQVVKGVNQAANQVQQQAQQVHDDVCKATVCVQGVPTGLPNIHW